MSDRRVALKVLATAAGGVAAGVGLVPALGFVASPLKEGGGGAAAWTRVARLDALQNGRPALARVVGPEVDAWTRAPDQELGAVWLIKDAPDKVRAYSVTCPHLGCAIDYVPAHQRFECPCHESFFGMDGKRTGNGPARRDMDPLETKLEDGWVSVRFVRFRVGTPDRVPVG